MIKYPENLRVTTGQFGTAKGSGSGMFRVPHRDRNGNAPFTVIASDEEGWEHVSVSLPTRCPTWEEMCKIKELFWAAENCVVQYHPPESNYVNNHRFCLHLWRPTAEPLPCPPSYMVGIPGLEII